MLFNRLDLSRNDLLNELCSDEDSPQAQAVREKELNAVECGAGYSWRIKVRVRRDEGLVFSLSSDRRWIGY